MKKTIKLTESDLRHLIKESINEVLNEYSTEGYGQIYNKLNTKTGDPAYDERARRLQDRVVQHVHDRYDVRPEDVDNYQWNGQRKGFDGDKYSIEKIPNKALKGISKMRQSGMPGLGHYNRGQFR